MYIPTQCPTSSNNTKAKPYEKQRPITKQSKYKKIIKQIEELIKDNIN